MIAYEYFTESATSWIRLCLFVSVCIIHCVYMLSDVLFAIDNPMNMENFLRTATYRITVVYWRVFFLSPPPPCHVLLLFANLLYLYVCLNADGCVGVRMFDGSYVCVCVFFSSSLFAAIHCRLLKWLIHTYPSKRSTEDG